MPLNEPPRTFNYARATFTLLQPTAGRTTPPEQMPLKAFVPLIASLCMFALVMFLVALGVVIPQW